MASTPASWSPSVSAKTRVRAASNLLAYLFVALTSLLYLFPFMRVLASNPDEGASEYGALAILHGAMPGREFIEFYAPGAYYWLALFFKLFGASVCVARSFLMAEGVVTTLLIFYLARRLGGMGLFAAAFALLTSIPLGLLNTPHYDANMFALLSFAIFLAAERHLREAVNSSKAYLLLFVSGCVAGSTSCIMQQKGVLFLLAFVISIVILRDRPLIPIVLTLLAGFALPIMAGLAFYVSRGALPDLIYANFVLPASFYNNVNAAQYGFPLWASVVPGWFATLHALFPLPVALAFVTLLTVPFLLILAVPLVTPALGYLHRSLAFRPEWRPYWVVAYALWASELHRLDLGHLRNGTALLALIFFTLCERYSRRFVQQVAFGVAACIICMGAGMAKAATSNHTVIRGRRGDLLSSQPDKALDFLMEHTQPGEAVFVYPYHPLYYFFAGLTNPTRLSFFLYDPAMNGLFHEAVHNLDIKRVRYVLWDTALAGKNLHLLFPAYREPPPEQLIIEPYLRTHYHQIAFENGFHIMERNN